MAILKLCSLTTLVILTTFSAHAHHTRFCVDSVNRATGERICVVKHAVGDADYHRFGKVLMEKQGDKYFITFPFFMYSGMPKPSDNNILTKGTEIKIKLDTTTLKSETAMDTTLMWHYWWRYYAPFYKGKHGNPGKMPTVYLFRDKIPYTLYDTGKYYNYDLYGLCWMIKYEFTPAQMSLLSEERIRAAYTSRNSKKMDLPIKRRQALRIKRSAKELLRA